MVEDVEVSGGAGAVFATNLRYLVTAVSGYALGAGYITSEVQQALIGIAGIVAPLAWGWIATRRNAKLKVAVAKGDKTLSLKA